MVDLLDLKNSTNQNVSEGTDINVTLVQAQAGEIEKIRNEMKENYGWQSPYEYYYGSAKTESSDMGTDCKTILSVQEIEEFGKSKEEGAEPADKNTVPHYFWLNSLSNWCYFKASSYTPSFSHTSTWCPGPIRWLISLATFGLSEAIETISLEGWGSWWKALSGLAISPLTNIVYPWMQVVSYITRAGDLAERYGTISLPFLIYAMVTSSYLTKEADVNAEGLLEEGLDNPGELLMPRACLSLYMWNGFTRNWISVKALVDTYNRYCKQFSAGMYKVFLEKHYYPEVLEHPNKEDRVEAFLNTLDLTPENTDRFRAYSLDPTLDQTGRTTLLVNVLRSDPNSGNYVKYIARMLVMITYGFDPLAFDFLTERGNISKKQIVGVDNGNSHGWAEHHYMENWGMYAPLTRDSAKIKIFAEKSFQLINRAYTYIGYDWRDHNGWVHKNLGHPCFFRGNDDCLWISYWKRWTTGNLREVKSRSLLTETTKMDGAYDISKDDIENWDNIIDQMFEVHDDYGFDEWMSNCDYGLAYKKFTIDEESPSKISTFEESNLNPNREMPMNDIDRFDKVRLKISLSGGTVIGRDDGNTMTDVAKRWK